MRQLIQDKLVSGENIKTINGSSVLGGGDLVVSGSSVLAYVEKTANYTVTTNDYVINCTSGTFTITLPTAVGIEGQPFVITNTGSGIITLEGDGIETIQGDLTQTIYQDESFVVCSTGANWIVI